MTKRPRADAEVFYPGRCPGVYAVSPDKDHRGGRDEPVLAGGLKALTASL
jgi:hypothetical protein